MENPFGAGSKVLNPFGSKDPNEPKNTNTQPISNIQPEYIVGSTTPDVETGLIFPPFIKLANAKAEEKSLEKARKQQILAAQRVEERSRKQEILEENGGIESNIPINSEYWNLRG